MASVIPTSIISEPPDALPLRAMEPLENGERLDQPTFHARYEAMPDGTRAELINGIVYMMSPLKRPHGRFQSLLNTWLGHYEAHTPGAEAASPQTLILTDEDEVEPDLMLLWKPEAGGRSTFNADEYLTGSPELVVEVANSSSARDLHLKKNLYQKVGVKEYLVAVARVKQIHWFINDGQAFRELPPDADSIFRSREFAGLWLDAAALWTEDMAGLLNTLSLGLNSPEHLALVQSKKNS